MYHANGLYKTSSSLSMVSTVCVVYIYIYTICTSLSLRYKERLQWKYLSQQHRQLNALTSVKWRFIPSGSDDFRSGLPQHSDDSFLKKVE